MSNDNRCTIPFFGQTELLLDRNKFSPCCKIPMADINPQYGLPNSSIIEVRESIIRNIRHPLCSACWEIDDAGGPSYRRLFSTHFLQKINWEELDPYQPIENIEISFSNKCQMMCIYCNPDVSSMWQAATGKIISTVDNLVEDIIDVTKLKKIRFTGGEPMLEDKCINFLMSLDYDPTRKISIITNLSYGNSVFEKLISIAEKHKNLEISVSLDQVGENINRKYFNWELFDSNFRKLVSNLQDRLAIDEYDSLIVINCTVTSLTYKEVEDVIRYMLEFRKSGARQLSFNINSIALNSKGSLASAKLDPEYRIIFSPEEYKYLTDRERKSIIKYNNLLANVVYDPALAEKTTIYFKEYLRD